MDEVDGGVNGNGEEGSMSVSAGQTSGDAGEEMDEVVEGVEEMDVGEEQK